MSLVHPLQNLHLPHQPVVVEEPNIEQSIQLLRLLPFGKVGIKPLKIIVFILSAVDK